jgi:hypothetical protein
MNTADTEFSVLIQKELDKQVHEEAITGFMEDNAGRIIYHGGKEVKIPIINLKGLVNYDRENGYTDGAVTFTYQTYNLLKDRGRRFRIDALDVTDENFNVIAATIVEEFQRTKVIPEIDAFRISRIALTAGMKHFNDVLTNENVFSKLLAHLTEVQELTGDEGEIVILMARRAYNILMSSTEMQKTLDVGRFSQGELSTEVKTFNGAAIIPVPTARMKSNYNYSNDDEGGFAPFDSASDVNWLIFPKSVPVGISKTDNVKIITPENNQFADAWDIDYRKYFDVILPNPLKPSMLASFVQATTGV